MSRRIEHANRLIFQNNSFNGNVDPNTFDTIGRFNWARMTVKF